MKLGGFGVWGFFCGLAEKENKTKIFAFPEGSKGLKKDLKAYLSLNLSFRLSLSLLPLAFNLRLSLEP